MQTDSVIELGMLGRMCGYVFIPPRRIGVYAVLFMWMTMHHNQPCNNAPLSALAGMYMSMIALYHQSMVVMIDSWSGARCFSQQQQCSVSVHVLLHAVLGALAPV